jgi:hypothetical protein
LWYFRSNWTTGNGTTGRNSYRQKDGGFLKYLHHYNDFIEKENCWSWRNFLSASNSEEWKAMRKETMIWSLNKHETKTYMEDDLFRGYLNNLVMDSRQNLHLVLEDARLNPSTQLHSVLDTGCIGHISIFRYSFTEFPSCRTVRTLHLHSSKLEILGSYENMDCLELFDNSTLRSIGKMEKLLSLSLRTADGCYLFSLEQLISFRLFTDFGMFERLQDRFHMLEDLYLTNGNSFSLSSDGLGLKCLKSLLLNVYQIANVSGLVKLKSLTVHSVGTLLGIEEIFPNLMKFHGGYSLLNHLANSNPQLKESSISRVPEDLSITDFNRYFRFPIVRLN